MLGATLLASGCTSAPKWHEPWVYRFTTAACDEGRFDSLLTNEVGEIIYMSLIVTPFAIDTALLPVTIPHDLLFVGKPPARGRTPVPVDGGRSAAARVSQRSGKTSRAQWNAGSPAFAPAST